MTIRASQFNRVALLAAFAATALLGVAGCRQEMYDQHKVRPLGEEEFFADKRGSRDFVPGTISRGQLHADRWLYEGRYPEGYLSPEAQQAIADAKARIAAAGTAEQTEEAKKAAPAKDEAAPVTDPMQDPTVQAAIAKSPKAGELVQEYPFAITQATLERGKERFNIFCSPCHSQTGNGRGMVVMRGYKQPVSMHDERLRNSPPGHFFDAMTNGFGVMPSYRSQIPVEDRWAVVAYVKTLQLSQHVAYADLPADLQAKVGKPPATAPAGK